MAKFLLEDIIPHLTRLVLIKARIGSDKINILFLQISSRLDTQVPASAVCSGATVSSGAAVSRGATVCSGAAVSRGAAVCSGATVSSGAARGGFQVLDPSSPNTRSRNANDVAQ